MVGETIANRYRLIRKLGEGGMATVYEAEDKRLGRRVALKVLHEHMASKDSFRQRFLREATAASKLEHPNVVNVYDFSGEKTQTLWIVMELVEGGNLSELIYSSPGGMVDVTLAAAIIHQVCLALSSAHAFPIVHRDIKPDNILVSAQGRVKLTDFGIVKTHDISMTQTGTFMGSPSYMSPEQIKAREVSHLTDVYSLGVTFYEVLTGRVPFSGSSTHDVIMKVMDGRFQSPNEINRKIPIEFSDIIYKCMRRRAEERYQSVDEIARSLQGYINGQGFNSSKEVLEQHFLQSQAETVRHAVAHEVQPTIRRNEPEFKTVEDASTHEALERTVESIHTREERVRKDTELKERVAELPLVKDRHQGSSKKNPRQVQRVPVQRNPSAGSNQRNRNKQAYTPRHQRQLMHESSSSGGKWIGILLGIILSVMLVSISAGVTWYLIKETNSRSQRVIPKKVQRKAPKKPVVEVRKAPSPEKGLSRESKVVNESPPAEKNVKQPQVKYTPPLRNKRPNRVAVKTPPKPAPKEIVKGFGVLQISSKPASEIRVDGKRIRTTNWQGTSSGKIEVASGKREITLHRKGYQVYRLSLDIGVGESKIIETIKLVPALGEGILYVRTNRYPAKLTINQVGSKKRQETNILSERSDPISLEVGEYRVQVSFGKKKIVRRVEIVGGRESLTFSAYFDGE